MSVELLKHFKIILVIGCLNIFYGAYSFYNPYLVNGAAMLSLCMVVGVAFYFVLFQKIFDKFEIKEKMQKIVSFISAHTYGIYLFHMLILDYVVAKEILVVDAQSSSKYYVLPLLCLLVFVVGLAISIPLDRLICNPLLKISELLYHKSKILIAKKRKDV